MCELFGVSADHLIELNPYLKVLREHSELHPDGWGYASVDNRRFFVIKEPVKAKDSAVLEGILNSAIRTNCAIAHIRYATIGNVEYTNCHPFTERTSRGRLLTLAHNGTMFHAHYLNPFVKIQTGDTDSERILLHLVKSIDRCEQSLGRDLTDRERWILFDCIITTLAEGNKLNLIFSDGECLYVHTNCRDTLYYLRKKGSVLIATTPLTDEGWEAFPLMQLIAFRDGAVVFEGRMHEYEYIYSEEDLKSIYLAYSFL